MVIDAFEQSGFIEGEIRLHSVLHRVSECVQLILHGVKNRHVKHYNYHHIVFVFVIVVCIHEHFAFLFF